MHSKYSLIILKKIKTNNNMKKKKASKIQYSVFRKLFSRETRQHKRRVFLSDALKELQNLCGYAPNQIYSIAHEIAEDLSFNPFRGVTINNFENYCIGQISEKRVKITKVEIILRRVSLDIFDFFKKKEEYRINFYQGEQQLSSIIKRLTRF